MSSVINKTTRSMIGNVALDWKRGVIYKFDGQVIWKVKGKNPRPRVKVDPTLESILP